MFMLVYHFHVNYHFLEFIAFGRLALWRLAKEVFTLRARFSSRQLYFRQLTPVAKQMRKLYFKWKMKMRCEKWKMNIKTLKKRMNEFRCCFWSYCCYFWFSRYHRSVGCKNTCNSRSSSSSSTPAATSLLVSCSLQFSDVLRAMSTFTFSIFAIHLEKDSLSGDQIHTCSPVKQGSVYNECNSYMHLHNIMLHGQHGATVN